MTKKESDVFLMVKTTSINLVFSIYHFNSINFVGIYYTYLPGI